MQELDDAQGYFEQLRAQPRFREEAFYYLGRIAETEEQPLQALRSYSRVTSGTNVVEAQLRAANVLYTQLDDQEGALQHLREFGLGNPDYEIEMIVSQSDLLLRMANDQDLGRTVFLVQAAREMELDGFSVGNKLCDGLGPIRRSDGSCDWSVPARYRGENEKPDPSSNDGRFQE